MDDDDLDGQDLELDFRSTSSGPADDEVEFEDDPWTDLGARRGPRSPAEGVRIIGADEAAAAIESGHVAAKKPEDELRFGDVPPQPAGPRPSLRFPGADPASVSKPPVAADLRPSRDERETAAAEAARRWDEALARSSEGRAGARSPSALFGDSGTTGADDDDPYSYTRGTPPPPPPSYEGSYEPSYQAPGGPSWLDEDPDLLVPQGTPPPPPPDYGYDEGPPPPPPSMQHWTEPPSGEVPRILVDDDGEPQVSQEDLSAWGSLSARPRWRDQPTDWEDADFNEEILADEGHRMGALRAKQDDSGPFSFDDLDEAAPVEEPAGARRASGPRRTTISSLPTSRPPMPPGGAGISGGKSSGDLTTRVVTGGIAAGVLLVAAAIGPAALVFLVAVALTMASAELYHALRQRGYQPATLLGLVGAASLVGAVYWKGLDAYPLVIALFMVFTLLWYLTGVVRARPAMNVAVTVMTFLYIGFLGSFAALILTGGRVGMRILLGAIIATIAYDIGAFFAGRSMGRTPLAPAISPNKTVEGMVGASIVTLLTCLVIVRAIDPWDGGKAFWLALMVSVAAPLGDLCESMIKRDLDVKDMGSALPGHGGVLDRIDALLFVIPGTYYLVRLVFI